MNFNWNGLPDALGMQLLTGSSGKMHLTGSAKTAFHLGEGGANPYAGFGLGMLLAAWETDPLDGMLAGQLHSLLPDGAIPGLTPVLAALSAAWEPDQYVQRLQQRAAGDKLFSVLEAKRDEPSLFRLHKAVEIGPVHRPVEWVEPFLRTHISDDIAPALELVRSGLDLLQGDAERARERCQALLPVLPLPGIMARLGECELRLGNTEQALVLWREVLKTRPWDTSLLLKAHDVASGVRSSVVSLDDPVDIFLYTFNKADDLDQTLGSLAESELSGARVTVLNNGSRDDTAQVISRWQDSFGADMFSSVTLPVNVGAPAARNWLMRAARSASHPWTLFLDDDALVPRDWLGRLGAAVQAYPEAGVWGCKVVDAESPYSIQNADLHPRPDYAGNGEPPKGEMSDLHHQVYDIGGFDYLRPCASVTGCCHLFRTETLLESGDFDLRFTPSQFDDLDHDMRLVLANKLPVYQGHLAVRHMKRSGKLSEQGGDAYFRGVANHELLKAKLSDDDWESIRRQTYETLRDDICRKADAFG